MLEYEENFINNSEVEDMISEGHEGKALSRPLIITLILSAFFMLSMLAILSGCGKEEAEEIKIGVILPLTGGLANFGETVLNGIQLAVDEFEEKLAPRSILLVTEDSQGEPSKAVSAFNRLHHVEGVEFIIGDLTSSATLAMAPLALKDQVLLISPTASNPALSQAGPYFYRVWPSDDFDGKIAASYATHDLELSTAAIVYVNNDYGLGLKSVFEATFESLGGEVLLTEAYQDKETDFRSILTKIKETSAQLVYLPGHPQENGTFLRQAKEIGVTAVIFSNVAAEDREFLEAAGDAAAGLYFTAPSFDIKSEREDIRGFVNVFSTRFGYSPDVHAVKGHDAVSVLLAAFQNGMTSVGDVRHYLDTVTIFHSLSGDLSFDQNGDVITSAFIKKYDDTGSIVVLREVLPK